MFTTLKSMGLENLIMAHTPEDIVVSSEELLQEYEISPAKEMQGVTINIVKDNPLVFMVKRDGWPRNICVEKLTVRWKPDSFSLTGVATYKSTLAAFSFLEPSYEIFSRMGFLVRQFADKIKEVQLPTRIVQFPVPAFIKDLEIFCTSEELDGYREAFKNLYF